MVTILWKYKGDLRNELSEKAAVRFADLSNFSSETADNERLVKLNHPTLLKFRFQLEHFECPTACEVHIVNAK